MENIGSKRLKSIQKLLSRFNSIDELDNLTNKNTHAVVKAKQSVVDYEAPCSSQSVGDTIKTSSVKVCDSKSLLAGPKAFKYASKLLLRFNLVDGLECLRNKQNLAKQIVHEEVLALDDNEQSENTIDYVAPSLLAREDSIAIDSITISREDAIAIESITPPLSNADMITVDFVAPPLLAHEDSIAIDCITPSREDAIVIEQSSMQSLLVSNHVVPLLLTTIEDTDVEIDPLISILDDELLHAPLLSTRENENANECAKPISPLKTDENCAAQLVNDQIGNGTVSPSREDQFGNDYMSPAMTCVTPLSDMESPIANNTVYICDDDIEPGEVENPLQSFVETLNCAKSPNSRKRYLYSIEAEDVKALHEQGYVRAREFVDVMNNSKSMQQYRMDINDNLWDNNKKFKWCMDAKNIQNMVQFLFSFPDFDERKSFLDVPMVDVEGAR